VHTGKPAGVPYSIQRMADTTALSQDGAKQTLGKKSFTFFNDVAREMRKVSWPKRNELQDATVITLVLCVLLSIFTFGVDKIFETAIRGIFRMF
jgi:preprotein translocase subunit SecE